MRRIAFGLLFLIVALVITSCTAPAPRGAYRPVLSDPNHIQLAKMLVRVSKGANQPRAPNEIRFAMVASQEINASSHGNGVFYFTDGLARLEDEEVILGVVAHEMAHDDLGHVAKGQVVGYITTGILTAIDILLKGQGAISQIGEETVSPLFRRAYSRSQELEADAHAVKILERIGEKGPARIMLKTLEYLRSRYGPSGGGLFSTHPSTDDRVVAIKEKFPAVTEKPFAPKKITTRTPSRTVWIGTPLNYVLAKVTKKDGETFVGRLIGPRKVMGAHFYTIYLSSGDPVHHIPLTEIQRIEIIGIK